MEPNGEMILEDHEISLDVHSNLIVAHVEDQLVKMEEAIEKAKSIVLNDVPRDIVFNEQEWMDICQCSLSLSNANLSENQFNLLIGFLLTALEDCVDAKVVPSLREKIDAQTLLAEFVELWGRYKQLVCCLSKMFEPHHDTYVSALGRSFEDSAYTYFYNAVFEEMHHEVLTSALFLIKHERNGSEIPPNLVKNTYDIYAESALVVSAWNEDLDHWLMEETIEFYSELSSRWLVKDRINVYLHKAERVLELERGRISNHLPPLKVDLLLEAVRSTLVNERARTLVGLIFNF